MCGGEVTKLDGWQRLKFNPDGSSTPGDWQHCVGSCEPHLFAKVEELEKKLERCEQEISAALNLLEGPHSSRCLASQIRRLIEKNKQEG
jgi:hypothetical protein